MYTESLCEAILFARGKEILGNQVMEFGVSEWNGALNGYCKARHKGWVIADNMQAVYRNLGVGDYRQFPRKPAKKLQFDTVVAKDFIDSGFHMGDLMKEVHDCTKKDGIMILNCGVGLSSAMIAMTPNAVSHLAEKNGYEVPFYRIETESRTFSVQLNSKRLYDTRELRDSLYKFRETFNLRLSVIFKKTSDDDFQC